MISIELATMTTTLCKILINGSIVIEAVLLTIGFQKKSRRYEISIFVKLTLFCKKVFRRVQYGYSLQVTFSFISRLTGSKSEPRKKIKLYSKEMWSWFFHMNPWLLCEDYSYSKKCIIRFIFLWIIRYIRFLLTRNCHLTKNDHSWNNFFYFYAIPLYFFMK